MGVLSGLSVAELAAAVTAQDASRLVKVPGIGKKTAERLLLELKGKWGADLTASAQPIGQGQTQGDILKALLALGYSEKEAALALRGLPAELAVSDGIKWALRKLSH